MSLHGGRTMHDPGSRPRWRRAALGVVCLLGLFVAGPRAVAAGMGPSSNGPGCVDGQTRAEPPPGTHFTILVSPLDGDADGRHARRVLEAFGGVDGLHAVVACRAPNRDGQRTPEAQAGAHGKGRRMDGDADIVITGAVVDAERRLRLHFDSPRFAGGQEASWFIRGETELLASTDAGFDDLVLILALTRAAPAATTR